MDINKNYTIYTNAIIRYPQIVITNISLKILKVIIAVYSLSFKIIPKLEQSCLLSDNIQFVRQEMSFVFAEVIAKSAEKIAL